MKILRLFLKQQVGESVIAQQHLMVLKGQGIQDDVNAQVGSPRQVLLADRASLGKFGLQPGDLRENILVDEELGNLTSGQVLQTGDALLRVMFPCEPCAYLETLQKGLSKRIKHHRGLLTMVIRSGRIILGDPVTLTSHKFPPLPSDAKGRFYEFVTRIPAGKVVTTADVIRALGVTNAYYRVIPSFMKQAEVGVPVHRIVSVQGQLLANHCPDQADRLLSEGVQIQSDKVADRDRWQAENFYTYELVD